MSEETTEKYRNGHGEHDSASVPAMAEDFQKQGLSSSEVLNGGFAMNGATLDAVVTHMNHNPPKSE